MDRDMDDRQMESERLRHQVSFIEELRKMGDELREIEGLSKSLASKTQRDTLMNASATDDLMSSLKMKIEEMNRNIGHSPDNSSSDICDVVIQEIERQFAVEIDLANAYRQLEEKSGKLKQSVSTVLPRFSPDGDFGQLPMIQAVKNYHDAVATASRNFDGVPRLTAKLLQDLRDSIGSVDGIGDLSVLEDTLKQQYEILRKLKGRTGHTVGASSSASQHELETAGWQCFRK